MTEKNNESLGLRNGDALIVVDVQNDFLPGGSLAVPQGDEVVDPMNAYIARFAEVGSPIVATRDWHPVDHCSFVAQGGPWPPHCIQESEGAAFSDDLRLSNGTLVISKADRVDRDAYSGFEGTDLDDRLRELAVTRVFVGGLATDYCVLNTVKDALELGYETYLLTDAVRAVNVKPTDGEKATADMLERGARPVSLLDLDSDAL